MHIAPGDVQHRVRTRDATATPDDDAEVGRLGYPVCPGEHLQAVGIELGGQLGAALAAARTEDGTAGTGAHAQPEAVHLGATAIVRLESSLAHSDSSKAQL